MSCCGKRREALTRDAVLPTDPCAACAQAISQMYLMMAGQNVVSVETPQLGRVEYSKGSLADLQRLIDQLAAACIDAGGTPPPGYGARRRPISVEAWP